MTPAHLRDFGGRPGPLQLQVLFALYTRENGEASVDRLVEITGASDGSVVAALSGMRNCSGRHWVEGTRCGYKITPKGRRLARNLNKEEETMTIDTNAYPVGSVVTIQVTIDRHSPNHHVAIVPKKYTGEEQRIYFTDEQITGIISRPLQIGEPVRVQALPNQYNGAYITGTFRGALKDTDPKEGVIQLSSGERIIRPFDQILRA